MREPFAHPRFNFIMHAFKKDKNHCEKKKKKICACVKILLEINLSLMIP